MMEFLATNFNLPTIIVGAIVFGGVGWATWLGAGRTSNRPAPFFRMKKVSFG